MFKSKLIFLYVIISTLFGATITLSIIKFTNNKIVKNEVAAFAKDTIVAGNYCNYNFYRLKGYKYIKPLVEVEPECESGRFTNLKADLNETLNNSIKSGNLAYASIYLKDLSTNEWMVINPKEGFHPGSLIKVPVLITYLKMAEKTPFLLDKVVYYQKDETIYPHVSFPSDTIALGERYNINTLLKYMIVNSDNRATVVLEQNMDKQVFTNTFTDVGLKSLDFFDTTYRISALNYSKFFDELYNSSYLTMALSEFATGLLAESSFKEGITKLLPPEVKVAHKFGEWGDGRNFELHETGIIYLNNHPYLLTIMTRGGDNKQLTDIVSQISKFIFDRMSGVPT